MIHCSLSEDSRGECLDPVECVQWGREGCVKEHRGSRPGPDPTFADAAFRPFTPEETELPRDWEKGRIRVDGDDAFQVEAIRVARTLAGVLMGAFLLWVFAAWMFAL